MFNFFTAQVMQQLQMFNDVIEKTLWLFILMVVWSLAWKGIALWKSARLGHKWWFLAFLLINTLGLLEIIYIFFVSNKMVSGCKVEMLAEDKK